MNKLLMIFEFVFGCWHRNLSRPFTLSGWTYEVCLNCGKKFAYDRAEISSGVAQRKNLARHERSSDIGPLGEPSLTGRDALVGGALLPFMPIRSQNKSVGGRVSKGTGVAF